MTGSKAVELRREVWKFPLTVMLDKVVLIPMPEGSKIISCQMQGGVPTIWAECDTWADVESREFKVVGTGFGRLYSNDRNIGTVVDGSWVWHVYEVLK